jgi:hypothetical protein
MPTSYGLPEMNQSHILPPSRSGGNLMEEDING